MKKKKIREWMRVTEYAEAVGVTREAIYDRIRRGTIETKTEHGLILVRDFA